MEGVEIMNNEKLIKNLCEDELEKVSGGHALGDFAHNHPYLTFFGFNAISYIILVVSVGVPLALHWQRKIKNL